MNNKSVIYKIANFIMRSRLHAALAVVALQLTPLYWFANLIIALVTLRRGYQEGAYLLGLAIIPGVTAFIAHHHGIALLNSIVGCVLVFMFAIILRATASWSTVLETSLFLGLIAIILIHVAAPNVTVWWHQHLLETITKLQQLNFNLKSGQQQAILHMANIADGLVATKIIFSTLMALFIARYLQALLYNPGGLRKEIFQTRLRHIDVFILSVCLLGTVMHSVVAVDVIIPVLLPFFLLGLKLMHQSLAQRKNENVKLALMYGLMLILFPYIAGILIMLAVFDSCMNMRRRANWQN